METWTPEVLIKAQNPSLTITPKPVADNPAQVQYSIDTITQNTPSPTSIYIFNLYKLQVSILFYDLSDFFFID